MVFPRPIQPITVKKPMGFFIGLAVGLGIWCAWWNIQDRRKFREEDAYRAFVIYQKAKFARDEEATRAALESYRCEVTAWMAILRTYLPSDSTNPAKTQKGSESCFRRPRRINVPRTPAAWGASLLATWAAPACHEMDAPSVETVARNVMFAHELVDG